MRTYLIVLFSLFLLSTPAAGWNESTLYVYLFPHTHDDVGWLQTPEEYWFGYSDYGSTTNSVQYIIEGIIGELSEDPEKKFSYVEIAYFYRYWIRQDAETQEQIRTLVNEKQLEFLGGGWVMHDEAAAYYEDMIDNMALGQRFLKQNLNFYPRIGWQIDPFGHSSASAAIFAESGMDAFWMTRIDQNEKDIRVANQTLEFLWVPQTSQGIENGILSVVTPLHYDWPSGFCFDYHCTPVPPPIIDDPSNPDCQMSAQASLFTEYVQGVATAYSHKNIGVMMGGDFGYQISTMPYTNFGKIKDYINARPEIFNMQVNYSTPSDYLDALYAQNINFTTNTADFFPYSDQQDAYWTGFYTSRSLTKKTIREFGKLLQNARRLFTYSLWKGMSFEDSELDVIWSALDYSERQQAERQHHDSVTGTSLQYVNDDYIMLMANATNCITQNLTAIIFQKDLESLLGDDSLGITFQVCQPDSYCSVDQLDNSTAYSVMPTYPGDTPDGVYNPYDVVTMPYTYGSYTPTGPVYVVQAPESYGTYEFPELVPEFPAQGLGTPQATLPEYPQTAETPESPEWPAVSLGLPESPESPVFPGSPESSEFTESMKINSTTSVPSTLSVPSTVLIGVFNPIETKTRIVTIPSNHGKYKVMSLSGREIPADYICSQNIVKSCNYYFQDEFVGQGIQYYKLVSDLIECSNSNIRYRLQSDRVDKASDC